MILEANSPQPITSFGDIPVLKRAVERALAGVHLPLQGAVFLEFTQRFFGMLPRI